MHSTLRPLPIELVSSWSSWRPHTKHELPLTPPLSAVPTRRVPQPQPQPPALPPITHLDQHPSRISPVTPPQVDDASQWYTQGSQAVKLPPIQQQPPAVHKSHAEDVSSHPPIRSPPSEPVDWVMRSTLRSSQFLAEKTCEMICYLWFSSLSATSGRSGVSSIPEPTSATASLQLAVSPAFVRFMQKVLETTQVSQSVIVLALHYIYRLKIRNRYTNGQSGSEYRVAIAALMMANKFLDDNTYTNKTWSEVSGIGLEEINKMEREFLLGIDFGLYVDKATYVSWLNLLKGLVLAKEKDCRHWRRSPRTRAPGQSRIHRSTAQRPCNSHRSQRARSSSPNHIPTVYAATIPHYTAPSVVTATHTPSSRSGNKRSATDAFSPTSTSFPPIKQAKRPTGLSLDIPERQQGPPSGHSISPSEPLQSFSKLSLGASPNVIRPIAVQRTSPTWPSTQSQGPPRTLTSEYRVDEQRTAVAPQNLYYYSLACSPTEEENRTRKARLWCHQPPVTSAEYGYAAQPSLPMVVHSACASPHEIHGHLRQGVPTLPHFSELAWDRRGAPAPVVQGYQAYHQQSGISSAPFANAGPPGVQFQFDDIHARSSPLYNRM
ncbi:cyclin-domain-containing protein [Irpex rosettiformis]|uniref:Cyclin-domain-containing protein n=1 Tax=Irpex rosettiformis TaxID=378272 RepID=A0ACB8TUF3_9APHY|nr:cyclin-domain-containing protein [Irpex rosettiformis]